MLDILVMVIRFNTLCFESVEAPLASRCNAMGRDPYLRLKAHGLGADAKLTFDDDYHAESGYRAAFTSLSSRREASSFTNYMMMIGFMKALVPILRSASAATTA